MTLFRRLALPVLLAIIIPTSVLAASGTTVKLTPQAPAVVTETSHMTAKVNLHQKFTSLTTVCFTITFGGASQNGDLLDPGESIHVFTEGGGFGRINLDAEPRSIDTMCTGSQPETLGLFLDGKETVMIGMLDPGHVRITDVSVTAFN
jgi:hypothetical protein